MFLFFILIYNITKSLLQGFFVNLVVELGNDLIDLSLISVNLLNNVVCLTGPNVINLLLIVRDDEAFLAHLVKIVSEFLLQVLDHLISGQHP